jgi:hypothetical protein
MSIKQSTAGEAYRPLEDGERSLRRTCIDCGARHQALLWAGSTWLQQCRTCGAVYFHVVKLRRR